MLLSRSKLFSLFHFSTLAVQQAEARARYIVKNSVRYTSHLTLHKGNIYHGFTNINFETVAAQKSQFDSLRIDFQGKKVTGLIINENIIDDPSKYHKNGEISIPLSLIKRGEKNNFGIKYQNQYDKDGNGCVSFIDTDQKQYLYTQFEPYFANRVFPLFDQPDLKAPLTLTLACPSDWQTVLSNEFEKTVSTRKLTISNITQNIISNYQKNYSEFTSRYESLIPADYKITTFGETANLSSYLYCFVVGPYKKLEINLNPLDNSLKIPMRLYSIESLYPQLVKLAPFIEQLTVRSMNFFQKYFGYAYPFSKYDQVFAHEYKWGAMQNAGIVTFNDLYLFKDKVSTERMLSFGNTIVHELAHHWFGNLVTMKWWDDLWLNESFAEYISHFCLEKIKGELKTISFESAMLSFFNRKNWGYADDELITTHPIRTRVWDTLAAESIFDGITYSKGAATMKQLMYLIGEQSFSSALTSYFKKYEFSNAVLDDLLLAIKPHFQNAHRGLALRDWKKMWLQTAGTNKLSVKWLQGKTNFTIVQGCDRQELTQLRVHRLKIAFFLKNHQIQQTQVTVMPTEHTVVDIPNPQQTVAILLNYKDLTFAKIQIDARSRSYFQKNLHKISDSLSRNLIWKSYFNMVKDCKIISQKYTQFCIKNLQYQKSDSIFQQQLSNVLTILTQYTPKIYREQQYCQVFNFLQKYLSVIGETQQNRKIILKDKIIDFCYTAEHANLLQNWYYGRPCDFSNEKLNNTLRWKIVVKLFSRSQITRQKKVELFEDMKKRDSSDTMKNKQITCNALVATEQELQALYKGFFNKNSQKSITNFVNEMRGFNHEIHSQILRKTYFTKYFKDGKRLLQGKIEESERWFIEGDFLQNYLVFMDPAIDDSMSDLKAKYCNFKQLDTKNEKIKRLIQKKMDLLSKRIKVFEYYAWIKDPQ